MALTFIKPDISGNPHSVPVTAKSETKTDNYTVKVSDNGKYFQIATDAKTFTLPATANGLKYRFINIGAATNNNVKIAPAAVDAIYGTFTLAATVVVVAPVDNKYMQNPAGTSVQGDWIELTADGTTGWIITGSVGIWESE